MEIADVEINALWYSVAVDADVEILQIKVVDVIQRHQTIVDVDKLRTKQTLRKLNVKVLTNNV